MAQRGPPGETPRPDAWRLLAKKRALRYVGPSLLVVSDQAHIEGVIDDVAIVVDTCMESSKDRFTLHTRVTGRAVAPLPLRMAIQSRGGQADPPEGALQSLGEPEFDERFLVKAAPAGPARSLLGEDVRAALLRFPEPLVLTYAQGEVRLFWEGREKQLETLETAADIVLAACRFRAAGGYR